MYRKLSVALLTILMMSMTAAADPALREVVVKNMEATQTEDMSAILAMMHTKSPAYEPTKKQLPPLFQAYDLKYELISFEFIGITGEYALGRTKQRTTRTKGPAFRNNEIDMIQIFKKQDGKWKYWAQSILSISYL